MFDFVTCCVSSIVVYRMFDAVTDDAMIADVRHYAYSMYLMSSMSLYCVYCSVMCVYVPIAEFIVSLRCLLFTKLTVILLHRYFTTIAVLHIMS